MSQKLQPFHLAIPVDDLKKARNFYKNTLSLTEGRSSDGWVDFNFFGHQLVIHYEEKSNNNEKNTSAVDGKAVPIPHFGLVLSWNNFHQLAKNLHEKNLTFEIAPYTRFKGKVGEQATMFFYDPCKNALEFKAFKNPSQLFAH